MSYSIGYFNKPWNNSDLVILAQTESKAVAMFIRDSYREAYKRAGITTKVEIIEGKLPEDHRFAQ